MKLSWKLLIFGLMFVMLPRAYADIAEVERLQAKLVNGKRPVDLEKRLKRDHGLSDKQLAEFRANGLDDRQLTIAARFAKASGKPLASVIKMRVQERRHWSEIGENLGVKPSEVGLKIIRKTRFEYRPAPAT